MAGSAAQLTFILAALAALGPFTIDAFFPSLRAIGAEFNISNFQAQQLLTSYMVPYAITSLMHGSLSDALGRRRVILVGLGLYSLASVACALAPSFGLLLLARMMQGAVGGVGSIVGRAVVRDRFHGAQAQRVMSTIGMLFSLGPALAPIIGGWVHVWFGWRSVFYTMALFGILLMLLVWRGLPETLAHAQRAPLHLGDITRGMLRVLFNPRFLRLTAASGACFLALHGYIGSAPAIVLDHWHLRETDFWRLSMPIIGGFAMGAFASGRLAGNMDENRQAHLGFNATACVTAVMLAVQLWLPNPPLWLQALLLFLLSTSIQLMFPVLTLRVLDLFPNARGAASSAHSFFNLMIIAMMMGFMAPWLAESMVRLAAASFAGALFGLLLWHYALWRERKG